MFAIIALTACAENEFSSQVEDSEIIVPAPTPVPPVIPIPDPVQPTPSPSPVPPSPIPVQPPVPSPPPVQPPINPPDQVTKLSFERDINTTTNIDMVWVVDNSVSMVEEIEIIRENLGRFLLSLEDRAQLNFTLITNSKGSHGMNLSSWATSRGYRQISQFIDSHDSLSRFLEFIPRLIGTSLRPKSQKILVVVSDDNSEVGTNEFFRLIKRFINPNQFKIFGFVGLDKNLSPCIDRVGSHYIRMAEATGGQTFNICEKDWTPHFESLIKNIGQITKTEFTLPSIPKSELLVLIDGVATTKYKIEKNILIVNPENFNSNKKWIIEVSYK